MKKPEPLRLSDEELLQLRDAAYDEGNLPIVRTQAAIILTLATDGWNTRCASRLGVSLWEVETTKRKFLQEGRVTAIIEAKRAEIAPKEWDELREKIAALVKTNPSRRRKWTSYDIARHLGLNRYQAIERCRQLNIDPQQIADDVMRSKILEGLSEPPPRGAWSKRAVGRRLGLQQVAIEYWLRKLRITLPPSTKDKKADILAAIAKVGPGWSYSSVGRHLGLSSVQTRKHCLKFGLNPASVGQVIAANLKKLDGKSWTYTSLGAACGLHAATVTTYCKKRGIAAQKARSD